ncbi:hypothetical protein SBA3_670012 [Candidatus Sulfopaludibacter sp. SbA3]|nr:hypothetical protein SBA3_670012 [Candidatus Sulfopaludibacter sp. SbA3]
MALHSIKQAHVDMFTETLYLLVKMYPLLGLALMGAPGRTLDPRPVPAVVKSHRCW